MIEVYKSETGVDKWLRQNVFTNPKYKGVILEVGAATPEYLSNSYHWKQNGWRAICIEPNPYFVDLHKMADSEVYPYACSNEDADNVDFVIVGKLNEGSDNSFHSFSHLDDTSLVTQGIPEDWKVTYKGLDKAVVKVSVRKLDTILKEIKVEKIDILCIDVEGNEGKVLEGINFNIYKPIAIVLENINKYFKFDELLSPFGYEHVMTCGEYDEIFLLKK